MKKLLNSELIVNKSGSIYHLNLNPEDIPNTIITVGDLDRVDAVAKHLDSIEFTRTNREFKSVGGSLGNQQILIISTGIGTDNVDIVLNELNFLVNFSLENRTRLPQSRKLRLIRLGTSGAVDPQIKTDSIVYSKHAISGDGLLDFYNHSFPRIKLNEMSFPVVSCAKKLEDLFKEFNPSLTYTASGFYGPQFRRSGLEPRLNIEALASLEYDDMSVGNIEMETAGIYGLSTLLGFEAISINAILAQRSDGSFSDNPDQTVETMIEKSLAILKNEA